MSAPLDLIVACEQAVERRTSAGRPFAQRVRAVLTGISRPPEIPVEWTERFCLEPVDLAFLRIAAAVEDPAWHLVLGMLSGDEVPARPTVAVACELSGHDVRDPAVLARLGPMAALVGHRLLGLIGTGPLASRRLQIPDRVMAQVRGDDLPDPAVVDLLLEPTPMRLDGTDRVATALFDGEQLIWVHAPSGTAGVAMATAGCHLMGIPPLLADLRRLPRDSRATDSEAPVDPGPDSSVVADVIRRLVDEAALTGSILVLAGAELASAAIGVMRRAAMPVVAVSAVGWDVTWADRLPTSVSAPRLTRHDRQVLWADLLPGRPVDPEIVALQMTPEQIRQLVRAATAAARHEGRDSPSTEILRTSARRFRRSQQSEGSGVTIDDLVLPEHARGEVARLLDWARYRDEVTALGPLHGKGGKGLGICALFAGGPGTGKTLAAHVVADTLGMDLLPVEMSTVVSKYLGESEKNLEQLFAEAESLNAVLFFDEADALFGSRSAVKDSHDRYANQGIAYLLQRMESFDGITILATNLRGNLDPAFARRLHFIINFPDPDAATRSLLWRHHLAPIHSRDPGDLIDAERLGQAVELTGGDIRNVVLAAVYDAVAADQPLGMRHIGVALVRELAKLGRRSPAVGWLTDLVPPVGPRSTVMSKTG